MKFEKIPDFIKSFFYYPKMKKWFDEIKMSDCNRFEKYTFPIITYAWWHCHIGKLKDSDVCDLEKSEDFGICDGSNSIYNASDWKFLFNTENVEKKEI